MITFDPLWETMKRNKVTTYTLREKYKISSRIIQRLKRNESTTTYTLNKLCNILGCKLSDIAEYIPDGE